MRGRSRGQTAAQSDASIRFSFGRFTTDDEIERSAHLVLKALDSLSSGTDPRPRVAAEVSV